MDRYQHYSGNHQSDVIGVNWLGGRVCSIVFYGGIEIET